MTMVASLLTSSTGVALAAIWGVLWGSFFNVVICRLPEGESLVFPASHCRSCRRPLKWFDNVPVLSYLLLRGRCRHCKTSYSPRYLLVELLMAALALALYRTFVIEGQVALGLRVAQFAIASLFVGFLVALAFIDLATMRIPNAITYPGIPVAVGLSLFMGLPRPWDGLVGAIAGYLLVRAIADGWEYATGRQGMGYGDAKLLAMIGGLLGWQVLLPTLFLASLQGTVIGVGTLLLVRACSRRAACAEADNEGGRATAERLGRLQIPFGPFLGLAAIELVFCWDYLPVIFPYFY